MGILVWLHYRKSHASTHIQTSPSPSSPHTQNIKSNKFTKIENNYSSGWRGEEGKGAGQKGGR